MTARRPFTITTLVGVMAAGWVAVSNPAAVASAATVADSARTIPAPATAVRHAKVVDTLSYFLNTRKRALTGGHAISQTYDGPRAYLVKWAADAYETYTYDAKYIYLREDHSGSPVPGSYTFTNGRWMKRSMAVGERISVKNNYIQSFSFGTGGCTPTTRGFYPYTNVLEARLPKYDLGGTVGVQDVIVLRYDYGYPGGADIYEKMYYAKGLGLVKWEEYQDDKVVHSSTFNRYSADPLVEPDLRTECAGTPLPPSPDTPPLPASVPAFVDMLYSCVLDVEEPDDPGFNLWVKQLRTGVLTVPQTYTAFFGYQKTTISNEQFARKLYGCILFRTPGSDGMTGVLTALKAGTTRTDLVSGVLKSAEFNSGLLPRLEALR
ncbi:DUF4214 domain-containing protein [Sphaerisporangium corydalis]|uniref:DUF4214 domain-containing protein n=1 Tax=Sphaerisporangium corydalis TaxID=1441875 RepID=A0ABV9EQK6_9ACTN|nr:DUF4214 domain-containing protein [Sphaerisporangium corydalis]